MIRILIVSSRLNIINQLSSLLNEYEDIQISKSEFGFKALEQIAEEAFDLVIIDEVLNDMPGIKFAEKVVSSNPLINCAAISGLPPEQYHEATEGLGLLMQIPLFFNKAHIYELLSHLNKILSITAGKKENVN